MTKKPPGHDTGRHPDAAAGSPSGAAAFLDRLIELG